MCYRPSVLTLLCRSDVWETGFIRQLSESQTFHVFATPPTKVYVPRIQHHSSENILISALDSILGAVRTFVKPPAIGHVY